MESSMIKHVPYGLQILLEGVSWAVMENKPDDIAEFFALYFQDLVIFRKGHPDLDITELVHKFEFARENMKEGLEAKTSEHTDTLFSGEPKRKDKSTDTEEDQVLKEPEIQYSSKVTQYPSIASSIAESKSPPGSARAPSPEGPELVYVPAESTQLAAHALGNSDSFCSVRDVATSVQTLYKDSQTSENELTPVEGAAEDVAAVPAAEPIVEAVRSQPAVQSPSSTAGELGPSDSQADVSTDDVNQASSATLGEDPSPSPLSPPPPRSPAPKDPLQAVPSCNEAEVTSATEAPTLWWDGEPIMGAEVPPYEGAEVAPSVEQSPQNIIIPFVDQTACLVETEQPGNAGQGSSARSLENMKEGLEAKTSEHTDTLFSGEPKRKDKSTDTEEDQVLKEPEIQYSSKVTQYPSIASSIAESKSPPGSARAPSPEGPELVYVPAESTQLAAHALGNSDSFCSVRDVATSVQTLYKDSQTSENELTPVEGAAEDVAAVPAAEPIVEAVRSQPAVQSPSSTAGELGPSDSQADVSTDDVNQASSATLGEDPSPSPLSPPPPRSPAPKDPLQAVPSCNEAEVTSTTEAPTLWWDGEPIMGAEVPPYEGAEVAPSVEQSPQNIIIPFVDQTACLVETEQPGNAGQGSSARSLENMKEGLEAKTSEHTDTLFSGEPKRKDKSTDTEEDQVLKEPEIQYSSKVTQYPSIASSIAESKSPPGSARAPSPEGPELVYVPAESTQLAAHALGNSDSFCSVRDVATSVQTLYKDSQTSENELTPVEGAAEDVAAVPAAEPIVEAVRSQPAVQSPSSTAGELGPSDSQADVSTDDVNQASSATLGEDPSPSPLSPPPPRSPAPKDPLQAVPSCNEAEVTSTTEAPTLWWDGEPIMGAEVPPYEGAEVAPSVEQSPQNIIIPFVDQTACLVETEQPGNAGQGSSARSLENMKEGLEAKTSEHTDTLFSGEPKRKDKSTDTEEDQVLKEPEIQYSSKVTQYPSIASSIAESKSPPGSARAPSPEGPELVYVPAESTQLAAHALGNSDSFCSVRDVATSVQTLYKDSQTSENELTPVEGAAEDVAAVPAAEPIVEAVRSQPAVQSPSSTAGELGPSDSQADVSTDDVNQASSATLGEDPSPSPLSPPPPRSPAPKDPLQAVPSCNEAEVTSTTEAPTLWWDGEPIMGAEVPPYEGAEVAPSVEQSPQNIIIPFVDQTACLVETEQPGNAGQGSSARSLENMKEGLEAKTSEHTDTLFSGEPKRKDKSTDTEEDQVLKEPEIQYSSKVTQYPSIASSIAESKSPPGSARAPSPEGPELVYVPAESTQLAAHALGNSDSFCSVRDVATSVQTLYKDSQTSENELTPVEGAAEDVAAVPAAEPIVEAVRSQPAVQSPSSTAGELGPSDSQADVSTDDVNQASSATLGEDPSPSPLSPPPPRSPAPKDPLQAVPSCNEAEVTSATEALTLWWDGEPIMGAEVPPYEGAEVAPSVEQSPQKIIIPFVDQTACLVETEQPGNAGQGSSARSLENMKEGLEAKTSEHTDTLFSGEPKRKDKSTDTEEDQVLKEPEIQYSSKVTQYPSIASSIAESKSPPGSARAPSPEGPELVYVPAESTQLAAHALGNSDSFCSVRDVATSVQTLYKDSQTSENELTPVEGAAEDVAAVPAAEPIVEAVRSQPAVQSPSSTAGELGPSDSQADVSTDDVNQASSATLGEDPSPSPLSPPPPRSPAPKDPLQAVPSCNEAEVTSTTEAPTLWWDGEPIMGAEVPPYEGAEVAPSVEQSPQNIIIPFVDQTACLVETEQPGNAGQGSSARSLENMKEGLEAKTSEHTDTLFSGEPKRKDKSTDTEEDQVLKEPEIQYSSKVTQYPSIASSIAESKSPPGSARAPSPEGPELVYVPAESTQLAAHALGNSDSFCSVRDVATSVQTLYKDSQTSENELTPVEGAAEDVAAVPAAEPVVEAVRSQPAVQSPSSTAGELGPSDSQADVSTDDVNQASSATLGEDPSPSPLSPPPSPAPKDPLQAVPSCNKAEVTSTTEALTLWWDGEPIMGAEVPPYEGAEVAPSVEQFPQKIIIPFVDQTACLVETEQPGNAGQGSSATSLGACADDLEFHSERTESTTQVESAEQVYVLSAMASSEAGQPPPHSNVWTLYCLTDLGQSQKSPPSLPAGTGVSYSQATLRLSRGGNQQYGQPSQVSAPIYVMQEDSKRENAPPFILVGSNVQNAQDWKPIPGHAAFEQQDVGAGRFITVPVPAARPADEETDTAGPNSNSAEETRAEPPLPSVCLVAIPLDDVMSAKTRSPAGDKHTG